MYLPERDVEYPQIDLVTLIYESPVSLAQEDTILHAEAALPSNCITKAEARTLTKRLSYVFRNSFGIGENGPNKDVVICMSTGQILLPPLFFGVVGAGGVYSAASYAFTPSELARQVKQGDAKLMIISADCTDVAKKAARECNVPLNRVLVLESMGGKRSLIDLAGNKTNYLDETRELEWERITDKRQLDESLICLLYSSGTTGAPKGVCVSHTNMVSEGVLPQLAIREYQKRQEAKDPSWKFEFRTIAHLPVAHVAGVQGFMINPTISGGPAYWLPKFDFEQFLDTCKKFKVTTFFTVPPIYLLIAKSPLVTDQFKHMVHAISGAAPMGADLQAMAEKKLGCPLSQTWGLSEATGAITSMPWDEHDTTGSIAPLLAMTRLRIVDDEEKDVQEGEEGELIIKGPMVTNGYYNNAAATKEAFTDDGWFKTGDIGVRRNKKFYVVDRKKELIKYKGLQVAPAELEALLVGHNLIADAAVIGVPEPESHGNELPRAYVVADKSKISEQEIKDYVRSNLAQHKQLRGGVIFVDEIPKSPSGKILRRILRDEVKKEFSKGQAKL